MKLLHDASRPALKILAACISLFAMGLMWAVFGPDPTTSEARLLISVALMLWAGLTTWDLIAND